MTSISLQLVRRHAAAFVVLAIWYAIPWFTAALGLDLSLALRFSWMAQAPFALYLFRVTSGNRQLGVLPLERRKIWQITCVVSAIAPALMQLLVAMVMRVAAAMTLATFAAWNLVGIDTLVLGAAYSFVFLLLVLVVAASVQTKRVVPSTLAFAALGLLVWFARALPSRTSEFTPASALAVVAAFVFTIVLIRHPGALAAPAAVRESRKPFAIDFPNMDLLDRLTGVKRILLVHTLFGVLCLGLSVAVHFVMPAALESRSASAMVADELRAFSGRGGWVLRPGDSWLFMPMWIIGFVNVWAPMARQLRSLPLSLREINVLFLAAPVAIWAGFWLVLLGTYAFTVGGPMTPRLDLFLAVSGSSALANVISLRWKNRIYGMIGVAFVYGFWMVASILALVMNQTEVFIPLLLTGITFYAVAIALNHNTLVHATSASAAYQRQPKFFDTPARG